MILRAKMLLEVNSRRLFYFLLKVPLQDTVVSLFLHQLLLTYADFITHSCRCICFSFHSHLRRIISYLIRIDFWAGFLYKFHIFE